MKDTEKLIKVGYSISPRTYYELMCGDKHELAYFFRTQLCDYLNASLDDVHTSFIAKFTINNNNVIFLLNDSIDEKQCKNYVKVCDLSLNFFSDLAERYNVSLKIRNEYTNKAIRKACAYLKNVARHLHANIPQSLLNFTPKGATKLRLEALSYEEFKNMRDFNNKNSCNVFGYFAKVSRDVLNYDFFLELRAMQNEKKIVLWDCRDSNVGVCYELLRYTEQDFDFLDDKDARVQKSFVKSYAAHIILNNLKQILKGVKNG